jgi:hypothetical protein
MPSTWYPLELLGGFSSPAISFLQLKAGCLAFAGERLISGTAHVSPPVELAVEDGVSLLDFIFEILCR